MHLIQRPSRYTACLFSILRTSVDTNLTQIFSVCITSIVRVIVVSKNSLTDGSWVNTYPAIWAYVETSIAVVSACLPTIRPIYKYAMYGKKGLSKYSSDSTSGDANRLELTKSISPWSKGQMAKEREFSRLDSGNEVTKSKGDLTESV